MDSLASPSRSVVGGLPPWLQLACSMSLTLVAVAGVVAGCQAPSPRPSPRDPLVVGVIREVEFLGSRKATVTLHAGATVTVDFAAASSLYGTGPSVGDLFLYGSDASGTWYVEIPPSGDTFPIFTDLAGTSPDNTITFEFGLRLPLAQNHHEGYGPMEPGAQVIYHVNEQGEVTALGV